MTLKLNRDLNILKMYLQTKNEVARSNHSKYIARIEKYENSSQGQKSRSNVTDFQSLLAFTMVHIPTKLHRFLISSFRDFVRTHRQTPPKTIPARSMRAYKNRSENGIVTFGAKIGKTDVAIFPFIQMINIT